MRKSSVYLPEQLKAALSALAARSGRSEAELIRVAVDRLVASAELAGTPERPAQLPRLGARLTGVGVGPGEPGLVCVRALQTLAAADRVFAPSIARDAIGRAETVVRQAAPGVAVERLVFVMEVGSASRAAALAVAAERIAGCLDAGEHVAFVTLGDPNVYSTFSAVATAVRAVRPAVEIDTVPGVMAFQELASRSGTTVVDGDEELALVALLDGTGSLEAALDTERRAVVVYKGGRHLPDVASRLEGAGRLEGAVVGELLGLVGERCVPVAEAADRPAGYLATVLVPPRRAAP